MRKRTIVDSLMVATALVLSGEVLVRRWLFDQVPTQLPALAVYAVLALNLGLAVVQGRRLVREATSRA